MHNKTTRKGNPLASYSSYVVHGTPAEPIFDAIVDLAATLLDVPMAAISLFTESQQALKASHGLGGLREVSIDDSFCHKVLANKKELTEITDAAANLQYATHPMVAGGLKIRFYAGVPLLAADGYNIGSFCVLDQKPRTLSSQERVLLKKLAGIAQQLLEVSKFEQHLARMGRLLESSDDGICVLDADSLKFEYANPQAQGYLGRSMAELRKLTPQDLQPATEFKAFQAAIKPLYFKELTQVDIETVGLRKDGKTFPADLRLQLWYDGPNTKLFAVFKDISKRKAMELALADNERRLQAIMDAVPECIKLISPEGGLLEMTPAGIAMLEADSLEQVRERSLLDFIKPEHRAAFVDLHKTVFQGQAGSLEFEVVGMNGTHRTLETNAVPLRDSTGEVISLLGASRDITVRKKAERNLALLSAIVENSKDAIISKTLDGIISSWNRGAENLFGYSEQEVLGKPILFLMENTQHPGLFPLDSEFYPEEQFILEKMRNGENISQYETKRYRKDGKLIDVSLTISPIKDEHGTVIGISNIAQDITARKSAEEALFQEKELAQVTLKSIGDAVITTDTESKITYLNPIAEIMTGWNNAQAQDRPLSEVFHIIEASTREPAPNPIQVALKENKRVGLAANTALVSRLGVEAVIEDSASPIHDQEGNVVGGVLVFRDVSETRNMAIHMTYLAQHDFLTDLPNRVLLHDRLAQAINQAKRDNNYMALLFIDLDRFKQVNDSLGHATGDKLLVEISNRLKACVRKSDTISRQGGDEFVAVLPNLGNLNDVMHIAEKIRTACAQAIIIDSHEVHVSVSVGISLYPFDGKDIDTLSRNADAAMYHAKALGRNNFQFYTPEMNARAHEDLILENDLHRALKNKEFVMHYQPIFDIASNCIIACEALIRWQDPKRGMMQPNDFLPIAENNGLIVPISQWALKEACRQNQAWQTQGYKPIPVAVNLSSAQFKRQDFLSTVKDVLAETRLDPQYLELEITETIAMSDAEASKNVLGQLKDMGIQLSIDDFGTGYSSLSYLRLFPIDKLKIDQSFVRDLMTDSNDAAITSAIINMAKSLHQQVVAEGVENSAQLEFLESHGCDACQGFYLHAALPPREFARLLS